jgi:hypothetical protein
MSQKNQNELGRTFTEEGDIKGREAEVVEFASTRLDFVPDTNGLLGYTSWWRSERAGAFRWSGQYKGQPVILKVQGVKPRTSEITALQNFEKANQSNLVRPPHLLAFEPWKDQLGFELLIIEYIVSDKLITYPTSSEQIAEFFRILRDYQKHAIGSPWISAPDEPLHITTRKRVEEDLSMAEKLYPEHPLREQTDFALIERGMRTLERHYSGVKPIFQHTHISTDDVFKPNGQDPRYIYTSNFMWGWEAPYFDATYAYFHYDRLLSDRYGEVDAMLLESQANLWKEELYLLAENDREALLLRLALLN